MDQHLSIEKTGIQGLYVVNPASYKSDEDLIVETYNSQELLKNSLNMTFVQENQSMSVKGVLRGLHVQKNFPQGKLVRVVRGKIYDVAVDTRTTSSTYGDWYGVEPVSYTHLRAHETDSYLVCRLLLEKKKKKKQKEINKEEKTKQNKRNT